MDGTITGAANLFIEVQSTDTADVDSKAVSGGIGSGLAFRILEASYRLQIPKMFAALLLIILTGIAIYLTTNFISHMLLRKWHESAIKRES